MVFLYSRVVLVEEFFRDVSQSQIDGSWTSERQTILIQQKAFGSSRDAQDIMFTGR
jgi:hypothetical protein